MLSSARVVPWACTGRVGVVLRQLLETVVDILRNQAALLDPAFLAAVGADADEAPLLLQHFDAIAVVHRAHLVVHGGHAIAQAGLSRGNVHVVVMRHALPLAGRTESKQQQHDRQQSSVGMGTRRFHCATEHYKPVVSGQRSVGSCKRDACNARQRGLSRCGPPPV